MQQEAARLSAALPAMYRSAFYQLVAHPIEAMGNLHAMRRAQAEGRMADAQAAFARDRAIQAKYEALEDGKWHHMMSQTHISYTGWQQPDRDVAPEAVAAAAAPVSPALPVRRTGARRSAAAGEGRDGSSSKPRTSTATGRRETRRGG